MGPLRKFQSQLFKYVLRHPQLKKMVEQSAQYAARNPAVRNMQSTVQSAYEGAKAKANGHPWGPRIMAFITANLLGILLFLPMIWGAVKHNYRSLTASTESGSRASSKKKDEKERGAQDEVNRTMMARLAQGESAAETTETAKIPNQRRRRQRASDGAEETRLSSADSAWATHPSSAMFDDTQRSSTKRGDNQQPGTTQHIPPDSPFAQRNVDFSSSFLVKMGDATEFTSSLEHEALTGKVTYNK